MREKPTEIVVNARLEVLRELARWRDTLMPLLRKQGIDPSPEQPLDGHTWPREDAWQNKWDDIVLAVRELSALGHISVTGMDSEPQEDWGLCITDAGYDWINAHDALGEAEQEAPPRTEG